MIKTIQLQKAIKFAIKTHEVYQKQKRKGKNIAYITHPLTVGLLLSQNKAKEGAVLAGILHDTIEDSVKEKKVSYEMLKDRFDKKVADLVLSVSEKNKDLSWKERKEAALEEIKEFSKDSLLLKSADIISNLTELVDDYDKDGDKIFKRFNANKEEIILHQLKAIQIIVTKWPKSPFASDLTSLAYQLRMMHNFKFITNSPAKILPYGEGKNNDLLTCPLCDWRGKSEETEHNSDSHYCLEVSCPICNKILLVLEYAMTN